MKKLTSDVSPNILEIPQHKPLFYPIVFLGFLNWFALHFFYPVYFFDSSCIRGNQLGRQVQTLLESIERLSERLVISLKIHFCVSQYYYFSLRRSSFI